MIRGARMQFTLKTLFASMTMASTLLFIVHYRRTTQIEYLLEQHNVLNKTRNFAGTATVARRALRLHPESRIARYMLLKSIWTRQSIVDGKFAVMDFDNRRETEELITLDRAIQREYRQWMAERGLSEPVPEDLLPSCTPPSGRRRLNPGWRINKN